MKDYDPSVICDYVTLFIKDANNNPASDLANGKCCWNIPYNAYYFKDRGTISLMSVVDANLSESLGDGAIFTQRGFNGSSSDATTFSNNTPDLAMLGSISVRESGLYQTTAYQTTQNMKLLTPARPTQIQLYFFSETKDAFDFTGFEAGHVTIKFEYVNPAELQKNVVEEEYTPLKI